ncbi:type II toxin-antitoxin system RelE/ParE family toxin [bacterium]|nr:type II toxin-antitoxin system RelE/ParE family toxin [bacterium]
MFIESTIFEKLRSDYLSENEFLDLQLLLLANPKSGSVIKNTGGLRKIRFKSKGRGKRGGTRIIYFFLDSKNRFYLLTLYSKDEIEDLASEEKKKLKKFMEAWRNEQT